MKDDVGRGKEYNSDMVKSSVIAAVASGTREQPTRIAIQPAPKGTDRLIYDPPVKPSTACTFVQFKQERNNGQSGAAR